MALAALSLTVVGFAGYVLVKRIHELIVDHVLLGSRAGTKQMEKHRKYQGLTITTMRTYKADFIKSSTLDVLLAQKVNKRANHSENVNKARHKFLSQCNKEEAIEGGKVFKQENSEVDQLLLTVLPPHCSPENFLKLVGDEYKRNILFDIEKNSGRKGKFYSSKQPPPEVLAKLLRAEGMGALITYTGDTLYESNFLWQAFDTVLDNLHQSAESAEAIKPLEEVTLKPIESVTFKTHDQVELDGVVMRSSHQLTQPPQSQKWVICLMAKDQLYEHSLPTLKNMSNDLGCNLLAFNYRGVGDSQDAERGSFDPYFMEEDLVADGEAAVRFLLDQGIPVENILLHGHSQGGAVAAQVAALHQDEERGKGIHLCIDRSFSSYEAAATALVGKGIARIASYCWKFNTVKALEKPIKGSVIVIDHPDDGVILPQARIRNRITGPLKRINNHIKFIKMPSLLPTPSTARQNWGERITDTFVSSRGIEAHNISLIDPNNQKMLDNVRTEIQTALKIENP